MHSWVRVFVIAAGLFLPLLVAFLPPPATSTSPDAMIGLAVDLPTADPDDVLTYTIWIDNGGPEVAPSLWVNNTVPTGTVYVDDTAATDIGAPVYLGKSFAGNTVRFEFANYPAGNLSFKLRARVGFAVTDGETLQNVASLWYTNATGVAQTPQSASALTTISIPVVSVTKTGVFTALNAITYTITVSNSGSGAARNLWWNDSLPNGVLFSRVRPPLLGAACSNTGQWVNCTMTVAFTPGSRVWGLEVTVPTPLPPGSRLRNWVFVNYTDSDGTYLGEVRASADLTIATADIAAFKFADAARVPPGGTIGYTIFYNNTGQLAAGTVWINDTLPTVSSLPGVTYMSATPAPIIQTQSVVKWQFANVGTGVHYVTLIVAALNSLTNGTVLVNSVGVNYTDANGNLRPGTASSATTTVSVNIPAFTADLVANKATVEPAGTIGYSLYYNNSRPALAASVIIEVLVPPGSALASANPAPDASPPGKFTWNLTNVAGGMHRIALVVDVPANAIIGSILRTTAYVNYTDDRGTRVGGAQTSADVRVSVAGPVGLSPYLIAAVAVVAAVIIVIVLRLYLSSMQQTLIDDLFLLHKDGLLIKHYTRRLKPDVDSDVLSGMLIAVQNFVNESFIGEAGLRKEGQLDEMKFGQYKILLTRGKDVIVAAVVSGSHLEKVPAQLRAAIDDLEGELGGVLSTWEGDMEKVAPADEFMQDLIAGKYRSAIRIRRGNH